MVEFIRAKKTSFINKPVGVVSVDTGGIQAAKVQADVFNSLATMYFKDATEQEIQKGKDFVANLSTRKMIVEESDPMGNLLDITLNRWRCPCMNLYIHVSCTWTKMKNAQLLG